MTIRKRTLLAIIVSSALAGWAAGAALMWFAVHRQQDRLPTQQPKTTAELLVGKWQLVKRDAGRPAGVQKTIEYTANGEVVILIDNPLDDLPRGLTGIYRLEGRTIWRILDPGATPAEHIFAFAIQAISEDALVIVSHTFKDEQNIHEYQRLR